VISRIERLRVSESQRIITGGSRELPIGCNQPEGPASGAACKIAGNSENAVQNTWGHLCIPQAAPLHAVGKSHLPLLSAIQGEPLGRTARRAGIRATFKL
jgi:hypothetical protein